jgi:hypothetical protein
MSWPVFPFSILLRLRGGKGASHTLPMANNVPYKSTRTALDNIANAVSQLSTNHNKKSLEQLYKLIHGQGTKITRSLTRYKEKRIDYAVALNVIPLLVPGLQEKEEGLNLTLKIYLDIASYGTVHPCL